MYPLSLNACHNGHAAQPILQRRVHQRTFLQFHVPCSGGGAPKKVPDPMARKSKGGRTTPPPPPHTTLKPAFLGPYVARYGYISIFIGCTPSELAWNLGLALVIC
jgi:hypothetical protein